VSVPLLVLGAVLLWLLKQAIGMLVGQQVKGSIPDYTIRRVKGAARLLPDDLAADYERDWLAELETLDGKPLSAIRYAVGLPRAARSIAAAAAGLGKEARWWPVLLRLLDIGSAFFFLIATAPIFLLVALTAKVVHPRRPLLIRLQRQGRHGKSFDLLCFPTKFPLFMSPSLLNVLWGNMSFIGPPARRLDEQTTLPTSVRPGVASWEVLVTLGFSKLSLEDARRRDQERTFKNDLVLYVQPMVLPFSGVYKKLLGSVVTLKRKVR
jgi:hypothetical protein